MIKDRKKVFIESNNGSITRMANKYTKLNTQLRDVKEDRDNTLNSLRDIVLDYFTPADENKTRVLQTQSLRITVNKRTIRNVLDTNMEAVFENISELYQIPRNELDKIVDDNSSMREVEVKPALKVGV